MEAQVEAVAACALGSRAMAVRAFRRRLPAPAHPAAAAPEPSESAILLAAQARLHPHISPET